MMHSRTAEALSNLAPRDRGVPSVDAGSDDGPEGDPRELVDLIAMAVVLQEVHIGLRLTGKDIAIRTNERLRLEARWTVSQADAVRLYDRRVQAGETPFVAVAGLPLGEEVPDLTAVGELEILLTTPSPLGVDGASSMEAWGHPEVHAGHSVTAFDLSPLSELMGKVEGGRFPVVPAPVRALAVLLRAVRLVFDELTFGASYDLLTKGMIEALSPAWLAPYVSRTLNFQRRVFPGDEALSVQDWMRAITDDSLIGSVWPVTPGPTLRIDERSLILDVVACSLLFHERLGTLTSEDGLDAQRGGLFEVAVQALIDRSPWGGVPEDVRALRGRQLQDSTGQYVTDIDAIGFRDERLLLVDCLSKVKSQSRHLMGERGALLTDARRVESKVGGPRQQPERAWKRKCARLVGQRGRNFDLSRYADAMCVVVTPVPIYVEEAFVGRTHIEAAVEADQGLLSAASFGEFAKWLAD